MICNQPATGIYIQNSKKHDFLRIYCVMNGISSII